MPRLQRKPFSAPDEVRSFPNGRIDVVTLDEVSMGRFVFAPGWRWSVDVAPITGARSCQHRHLGYTISGSLEIFMDDGTRMTLAAGDAYEIPPGHDARVVGDEPWDSVEFTSAHDYARPPDELGERVLATILFSDIVDSTKKLEEVGDKAWAAIIRQHNERIRTCIDRYKGRELASLGDGFLALFDGAARAIHAAEEMDRSVADLDLRVRVGIHTGDVEISGGQARGVAVHAAARVSALAGAGEVLVSGTTCDMLDGSGIAFDFHGNHELKGLTGPRPIFSLRR
jgi:class 3 adenylate cyclase